MNDGMNENLAASDSEIERALDELEHAIPRFQSAIGQVIDNRYRVTGEIGRGGFGRVYEVRHVHLGHRFALKILHPEIAHDPKFIRRFQEEAKATSLIGHDNIVFVTDFGHCAAHGYFLTMELLEGDRLTDILVRRRMLSLRETLDCLVAVGSALSSVHALGIVHLDLKPANIMHARRPGNRHVWKVLDFGTASIINNTVESGSVFGTPRYMSPEHADGEDIDPRADVFALGCVVYEMLSGRVPWVTEGWADAYSEVRARRTPRPLYELNSEVNEATSATVMRAIEVSRKNRWPDVESFVAAFRDAAAETTFVPVGDSLDSVAYEESFRSSKTAPVTSRVSRSPSLVIERPIDSVPCWRMVFGTAERMRREYRRNLIARGLFVTADGDFPDQNDIVAIRVVYEPADAELKLEGRVVSHCHQHPTGFGVELSPTCHAALEYFLDKHGVRRSIGNGATIARTGPLPGRDWTQGQNFVLSLAEQPISISELRTRASGLPFDIEEAVFSLADHGVVRIDDAVKTERRDLSEASSNLSSPSLAFSDDEVDRVLELSGQFRRRGNFLAAQEVLERAAAVSDQPRSFLMELEKLRAEFAASPRGTVQVLSKSYSLDQAQKDSNEDTRGRLRRILGTDPLDD